MRQVFKKHFYLFLFGLVVPVTLGFLFWGGGHIDTVFLGGSVASGFALLKPQDFDRLVVDDSWTLIDVRTPSEYQEGHIEGAINLDIYSQSFVSELKSLDRSGRYALYCRSGNRSAKAALLMKQMGFVEVADLDGGVISWLEENRKICYDC